MGLVESPDDEISHFGAGGIDELVFQRAAATTADDAKSLCHTSEIHHQSVAPPAYFGAL
jgi:hypothetical protein